MSLSKTLPFFWWFDFMQRTKCGSHLYMATIRPSSDSLNCAPSVRRFLAAPADALLSLSWSTSSLLMSGHLEAQR